MYEEVIMIRAFQNITKIALNDTSKIVGKLIINVKCNR